MPYLFFSIGLVACLFAMFNASTLICYQDMIEAALKAGVLPPDHLIATSNRLTRRLLLQALLIGLIIPSSIILKYVLCLST